MDDLPETFNLPPELRAKVAVITDKYRLSLAMQMAGELSDAGVDMPTAFQITVGELVTAAARMGMLGALGIEKREPRQDLWMKRAAESFDDARRWFTDWQASEEPDLG
ncbi:hypothetical protein PWG15_05350 [Ensifer adhaerens]|uniref:hypothetical protein n=1 Tax=Ensifer adhaerens TaxID=106592 RepID=UPI0023A96112|nr:hypothetical protein [Ensifer adhaerens]WDZ77931.1 hypothetical protein PWG15_05350 [Ensifer adhaerens]